MLNKLRYARARRRLRAELESSPKIWRLNRNWPYYCLFIVILLCPLVSASWQSSLSFALPKSFYSLGVPPPALAITSREVDKIHATASTMPKISPPITVLPQPGSTHNGYAYGNCTYYVAQRRAIPGNWGSAHSWYYRAQAAGFKVGSSPVIGAIGWTPDGWYGHVVYVEQVVENKVLIAEMNNYGVRGGGFNRVDHRWVPAGAFKYIY